MYTASKAKDMDIVFVSSDRNRNEASPEMYTPAFKAKDMENVFVSSDRDETSFDFPFTMECLFPRRPAIKMRRNFQSLRYIPPRRLHQPCPCGSRRYPRGGTQRVSMAAGKRS